MSVPAPSRLQRYLTVILRWLLVAIGAFVVTMLAGKCIMDNFFFKVYTARAQIQVAPDDLMIPPGGTKDDPGAFQPVYENIIRSPDFLLPLILDLNLDKTWNKGVFKAQEEQLSPQDALANMNKILKLDLVSGTNVITITVSSDVPKEAADIANAIATRYKTVRDFEEDQNKNSDKDALRQQIAEQQKVVDEKKAEVEKLREELLGPRYGLPGAGGEAHENLNGLDTELDNLKKDLLATQEDYDAHRALLTLALPPPQKVSNLPDDQFMKKLGELHYQETDISELQNDILNLENDITNLLKDSFPENHPRIVALRTELEAKKKKLAELIAGSRRAIKEDTEVAKSRVELLQKQVDDLTAKLQSPQFKPLLDAQRDLEQQQNLLNGLNDRLKQIITDHLPQEHSVRILSRAQIPTVPNKSSAYLVTVLISGVASLLAASFVEMMFLFSRASTRMDN